MGFKRILVTSPCGLGLKFHYFISLAFDENDDLFDSALRASSNKSFYWTLKTFILTLDFYRHTVIIIFNISKLISKFIIETRISYWVWISALILIFDNSDQNLSNKLFENPFYMAIEMLDSYEFHYKHCKVLQLSSL